MLHTATVTKKVVNVSNTMGEKVTLYRGTELWLEEQRTKDGYYGAIKSGQEKDNTGVLLFTAREVADYLVFRSAKSLGYR